MNYTKYRFNLDMQSHISQISLPVRQRDTGISLYISLTDGGIPYTIKDGCRAVFNAKKADGNPIMNDCVILRNTLIEYELTEQTTICSGVVDCELRLFGTDGQIITSPRFIMVVDERVVHDEDFPLSEGERTIIDGIVADEVKREVAEVERESAEEGRVLAEEARVAAEAKRQTEFDASQNERQAAYEASAAEIVKKAHDNLLTATEAAERANELLDALKQVDNMDAALDRIIEIQESLIGGAE